VARFPAHDVIDLGVIFTDADFTNEAATTVSGSTNGAGAVDFADASLAGAATIDLGASGKLIAHIKVEGKWYYYWDRSGNGTMANTGGLNGGVDYTTHDVLVAIFNKDSSGVTNSTVINADGNYGTTDTYGFATINSVNLALPKAGGVIGTVYGSKGIGAYQPGTAIAKNTVADNPTYDDLLAVWDSRNGTSTGTLTSGTPSGWLANNYWSATPSASGHACVNLNNGNVNDNNDTNNNYVALEVL
jgi:hypothetical protein